MSSIGNKDVFARNLTDFVRRSGKEQREIAEEIGVASSTFSEWIKGKKYPRIDKIELLANYFGVMKSALIEKNPTHSNSLTAGEEQLINLFRQIPADQQQLVLQMIETALRNL